MNDQNMRNQLIQRGMQLAATLPDIMPDQASEQIKPIYEDIRQTLRVPIVNLIFRTLANYPDYLEQLWKHFSPSLRSNNFEQEADNLREKALLEPIPDVSDTNWEKLEDLEKLRAFNDTIFYVLPKLLLITTAFDETTFRTIREQRGHGTAATGDETQEIPQGVAEGTTKVEMVDPEKAQERVKNLFRSIKEQHGHPLVSSYFRGLGNWPDFLEETWNKIKPLVGSAEYNNLRDFLTEQALNGLRRLPLTQAPNAQLNEQQLEEVGAILTAFRYKFIPEMLIDVALIKALLDGPEEAYTSRFSAAIGKDEE